MNKAGSCAVRSNVLLWWYWPRSEMRKESWNTCNINLLKVYSIFFLFNVIFSYFNLSQGLSYIKKNVAHNNHWLK